MTEGQIKKNYIIYVLKILQQYSDFDHRLSQKDIIDYMRKDFGAECERKAVARNIGNLQDLGYEIEQDGGYFLMGRTFEDSELRLLIDSIMASRYIPRKQAKDLTRKLAEQSNIYFRHQVRHMANIDNMEHEDSNELFYTIDMISEAIEKKHKIKFYYNKYNAKKKLAHTTEEKHSVNPYQIVIANGKYYLIGNIDKYSNVTHFRVERITGVEMTEELVKCQTQVEEIKNGLDLPKHMLEHIYMFSGQSERITMRIKEAAINDAIDWLGRDIEIKEDPASEGMYIVSFRANINAMKYWALQFGQSVEILAPLSLREQIRNMLQEMQEKYKEMKELV